MTIRARNRVNFIFLVIASLIFLMNIGIFFYCYFTNKVVIPYAQADIQGGALVRYNFWAVVISIFIINLYVVTVSYIIIRTFEKTQATEVLFFLVFLTALLCDTSRLYNSLYGLSNSFSASLIRIGNLGVFARLLAPLSLFSLVAFTTENFRQTVGRNCCIIILIAFFFSVFLPLNTAIINKNMAIDYGFTKTVKVFTTIVCLVAVATLFINNYKNDFNQISTIGFFLMIIGYNILFASSNFLSLMLGVAFLSAGTSVYLTKIHQHYLWID